MNKNKVVIFDELGRARVFITENPDSVRVSPGHKVLVNPDLSYVKDVSPEFWSLEDDGQIMPLFDQAEIQKRLADLNIKSFERLNDTKIKENLSNLVDIPQKLEEYRLSEAENMSRLLETLEMSNLRTFENIEEARFKLKVGISNSIHHSHTLLMLEFERMQRFSEKAERVYLWTFIAVFSLLGAILILTLNP